jgi:hypothetical protein
MCCPEFGGRHNWVAFSHRQQVFIPGDEIVNPGYLERGQQSAQHRANKFFRWTAFDGR